MSSLDTFFPPATGSGTGGGGLSWQTPQTTDFTGVNGLAYPVDTTTVGITMTLPASPVAGDLISYKDYAGTFSTNPLTINLNGSLMEGTTDDVVVNGRGAAGTLAYIDATKGWLVVDTTATNTGIQTKPMVQARETSLSGTPPPYNVTGTNIRALNTIVTNDIGATLSPGGGLTLPAGEYYVSCYVLGPMNYRNSYVGSQAKLFNSNDDVILIGTSETNYGSGTSGHISQTTHSIEGRITIVEGETVSVGLDVGGTIYTNTSMWPNFGDELINVDLCLWKLDQEKVYPSVTDPTVALTKPLLQAKHIALNNVASIAGTQDRPLTEIINQISGASVSGSSITLPAGKYYMESVQYLLQCGNSYTIIRKANGDLISERYWAYLHASGTSVNCTNSAEVTLTEETVIKLSVYTPTAIAHGIGYNNNLNLPSEYASINIWQIDAVAQIPITRQPINTPITNAYTTGDIFGGELEWISGTQFNVKPVSCYSDDLTTALVIDSTTTMFPTTVLNTIYNVFIVKNNDTTTTIEIDTDVNGANLPVTVSKKRWLGFIRTNASNGICSFVMSEDYMFFDKASESEVGSVTGNTFISLDHSFMLPESRISTILYGLLHTTTPNDVLVTSIDGSTVEAYIGMVDNTYDSDNQYNSWGRYTAMSPITLPYLGGRYFTTNSAGYTANIGIRAVKVRR